MMESNIPVYAINKEETVQAGHDGLADQDHILKNIQMAHLRDLLIIGETGIERFTVLGIEAGIGKSLGTDNAIGVYRLRGGTRKFLLVKKFKPEVTDSVTRINNLVGKTVALGITGDTWEEDRKNIDLIPSFPVVIITHSRYLDLCLDEKKRSIFEQGRHTLVIDEQIEPPTHTFTEVEYLEHVAFLKSRWLQDKLSELCSGLFDEITLGTAKSKSVIACRPTVDLASLIEFRNHVMANRSKVKDLKSVKEFLEMVGILGSSLCFSYQGRITAIDSRLKLWSLQNNIILDASAGIDRLYDCSPNMTVDIQPRIIDNTKSVIRVDKFSTSKGSIINAIDYPEKICEAIRKYKSSTDKTLVVVHKDKKDEIVAHLKKQGFQDIGICDEYNGQDIAVTYYGNLIGKNHWRDFNQVWIVATNILKMELYATYQHFFSQVEPVDNEILMDNVTGGFGFIDEQYEKIRVGSIAKDIYQAIKRIDRNEQPCSEIFLVQSNPLVIDEVIRNFPGIQIGEPIDLNIHSKTAPRKESKTDIKAAQMASLILEQPLGNYEKKYLCGLLGWNRKDPNLNRIWKHPSLSKLEDSGAIKINPKTVTRF
ncbi:MAG: hypothetical protein P4L49_07020 [Desulfosporosinus sp.]|nr:hypothetical protein [Desulfosporosinus sp.]